MTMRIQLRSKHDHSIVLPEAFLYSEERGSWVLEFHEDDREYNEFYKEDWEPVPPPFTLPTGIGAVVKHTVTGGLYVRVSEDSWWSQEGLAMCRDSSFVPAIQLERITLVSEGIVV